MMKRPMLEFIDVNVQDGDGRALRGASFSVFEGELAAVVGADGSGKRNIVRLLSADVAHGGRVLLEGRPFSPADLRAAQRARVFCTTSRTSLLLELSIYENLTLSHAMARPFRLVNERLIRHEAQCALDRFGLKLDANARVNSLTDAERSAVELVKFHMLGAKLVVVLSVAASGTAAEDALFLAVARRLTNEGVSVLLLANQYTGVLEDVDRLYLLSSEGRIAWMARGGALSAQAIRTYLALGAPMRARVMPPRRPGPPVLSVRSLSTADCRGISFDLYPGQVIGLYDRGGCRRDGVPLALVGAARYQGQLYVDGRPVRIRSECDAFRLGIALMPSDPSRLYFPDLDTRENIEVPFWRRLAGRMGVLRRGPTRALSRDGEDCLSALKAGVDHADAGERIFPVLARFMLYPFKVIVLLHPSIVNDAVKAELLYDLVEQASARGCALIVVSTRMAELTALCSDIYTME